MKLKPPLLSRRVRTQPWSLTVLPIASGLRASATVILSIAGVPRSGSWGMGLPPQHSDRGGGMVQCAGKGGRSMLYITLTEEQARLVIGTPGEVEVRDPEGRVLGFLSGSDE